MNRLYLTTALLCIFALSGSVPGAQAAAKGLDVAKEGIETIDKALDLYNKVLDKIVPWDELNKTIAKLDQFRSDYSKEAAALIGDVKTKMMDGMDAYFRATQSVYEWCGLTIRLLGTYKKLFTGNMDQKKFNSQRTLLLKVLGDGIDKMDKGQKELGDSSSSFNGAAGKLTSLNHRLETDFNEKSEYYQAQITRIRLVAYGSAAPFGLFGIAIAAGVVEGKLIPELNAKMRSIETFYQDTTKIVKDAFKDIDTTKLKLKEEIRVIGNLKEQTEETKIYIEMDDDPAMKEIIVDAVDALIAHCQDYRKRHMDI